MSSISDSELLVSHDASMYERCLSYAVLTARIVLIIVGGYFLTGGVTALLGFALNGFGVALAEAMLWSAMLGFLIYVAVVMWAFAAPQRHRPVTTILIVAAITTALSVHLTPAELRS